MVWRPNKSSVLYTGFSLAITVLVHKSAYLAKQLYVNHDINISKVMGTDAMRLIVVYHEAIQWDLSQVSKHLYLAVNDH